MSDDGTSNPVPASLEPAAYPALFEELLTRVSEPLAVEERAYYEARIGEETAQREGAEVESASVLDACLDACRSALPFVLEGRVGGYGPLRARYLLETALTLAGELAALDATVVRAAGAGAARKVSLRESRELRRAGLRALKNLAGRAPELRAQLQQLSEEKERPDERARSLEALAGLLEEITAGVPPRVAADAGATPELIAGLRACARAVLAAREKATGERGSIRSRYDVMNVLDGRLLNELKALAGAMRDARRSDRTVPSLRVKLLRSGKRKKAAEAPAQP